MEPLKFTEEQKRAYRAIVAPNATDAQWEYFCTECQRQNLIPGTHVVFQVRPAKEWNAQLQQQVTVQKVALVTTINALRLIAERSGKFKGYGRFTYYYGDADGEPTKTSAIPLGRVPHAVSVELFRDGWSLPVFAHARYDACCQTKRDGNKEVPTMMWTKRGEEQLAKCAEAFGLRMVAPEECGGLYIDEEMPGKDREDAIESGSKVDVADVTNFPPAPTVAPTVNQAPASFTPGLAAPIEVVRTSVFPTGAAPQLETLPANMGKAPAPPDLVLPQPTPVPAPKAPPAAPPAPKMPPKPPVSAPVSAPAPVLAPNSTPAPAAPVAGVMTQAERAAFAEERIAEEAGRLKPEERAAIAVRIERDKDPCAPIPGVRAGVPGKSMVGEPPAIELTAGGGASVPAVPNPPAPSELPATKEQRDAYLARAAKIIRDTLETKAKMKREEAGALVKAYILKQSGAAEIKKITAAIWERVLSELELITDPVVVAAKIKETK